ncbi:tetratricopeptide repeat protein [Streptomyces sp. NRRL B-24484]|uniref:tetratricopeptide repeat protein n=1 Tax=Streptomyces sp. NRRL B-24484 TaxID=1463833 RepID=UPI00069322DB|nr:tetratricopeptide repeat protein [Streptomyces sp. NRRL B-24484]
MKATDPDDRWIPSFLVARFVELGRAEEVARRARGGDRNCAQEWARILGGQDGPDRRGEALAVLEPYLAAGRWEAVATASGLLERWRRADEAIALVRPHAEAGGRDALHHLGRLLLRSGRPEEAHALLLPHLKDWHLAAVLVEAAGVLDRDEEVAELLAARIAEPHGCGDPSCTRRTVEPLNAVALLAGVRERQGRTGEAVALLGDSSELADLLARHDRLDELREFAAAEYHGFAARRLAAVLEEHGDVAGAVEVHRSRLENGRGRPSDAALPLTELLVRHGRGEEAVTVLRAVPVSPYGPEAWLVESLCTLYADLGRPEDGLAHLDGVRRCDGLDDRGHFRLRARMLAACGRREQAIEEARARDLPAEDRWFLGELLSEAGRGEEALAAVAPAADLDPDTVAWHLLALGRVDEALALYPWRGDGTAAGGT